jgi:hypothetical protein
MEGEAYLWRSGLILGIQENVLMEKFVEQVEQEYMDLLKKINGKKPNLPELSRKYQQIVGEDYFHSDIGKEVREKLLALRGGEA